MAGVIDRLWVRLTLIAMIVLGALLPPLYLSLVMIDKVSRSEGFIDRARTYSRIMADEFELGDALASQRRTEELLDSIMVSGFGVYAEVIEGSTSIRSSLVAPDHPEFPGDDFEFGGGGDQVYYVSQRIVHDGRNLILRLGFDEAPTRQRMIDTRGRVLAALAAFTVTALALVILLAKRMARPVVHLQMVARRIAGGQYDAQLRSGSSIQEMRELDDHLDSMRAALVGFNARLSREMIRRAEAESERRTLEQRLRHRERVATVGTLAGGIAHEFNNILTPILLYSQTALDELPPGHVAVDDLRRVISSAHRARALINRVLAFSRDIETGPATLVKVGPVVQEAVELLHAILPANIDIRTAIDGNLPEVVGETRLVHQLVMNLCTNAYQAMRPQGGLMSIGVSRRREDSDARVAAGDYVVLTVADTGHGMDRATMNRIFEPFFTTREVGEGTGLGLSVAHGIATSIGATIVVDSSPGRGSEFRVYFPVPAVIPAPTPVKEASDAYSTDHRR